MKMIRRQSVCLCAAMAIGVLGAGVAAGEPVRSGKVLPDKN